MLIRKLERDADGNVSLVLGWTRKDREMGNLPNWYASGETGEVTFELEMTEEEARDLEASLALLRQDQMPTPPPPSMKAEGGFSG